MGIDVYSLGMMLVGTMFTEVLGTDVLTSGSNLGIELQVRALLLYCIVLNAECKAEISVLLRALSTV